MTDSPSLSVYETWVRTLRAWSKDPATDLSHLPAFDPEGFSPSTYERFVDHVIKAIEDQTDRWHRSFLDAAQNARDDHAMAQVLVDARKGLAHLLRLSRHPAFPEEIREALSKRFDEQIRDIQQHLEDSAVHAASMSSATNRAEREARLRLYRDNALTAVLDPGFSLDGQIDDVVTRQADAAPVNVPPPIPPSLHGSSVPPARRVVRLPQE
ncbi:MAG: hypothetical protein QM597_00995 [Aeromicrobium sp.]|uniref:hypothetical protein n=1 Tax=Aeromicrobium sp. TaxID=1871063 RepID=UPI0039E2EF9A